MENNEIITNTRDDYRSMVKNMGKKEFTFLKMQEYGFWPKGMATPYEKQASETKEQYQERKQLIKEYEKLAAQIADLYKEHEKINEELKNLRKEYNNTWNYERIRKDIAKKIMQESIKRRAERKKQKELEKQKASEEWKKKRSENIVFIGKGYSSYLQDKECDDEKLAELNLPIIKDDKELAEFLGIEYKTLRFLAFHRDVVTFDNYNRYTIPKKSGGERSIAAPKTILKNVQRVILKEILEKIEVSEYIHGFLKNKSIISGALQHASQPELIINMDIENFFPTINFKRVRGMFHSFGYSGYIASLLAMLCTYCERMPIEIKGETKYVKTSDRILPQGSPASPMITNIISSHFDSTIIYWVSNIDKYDFTYTRYADDMSFSFKKDMDRKNIGRFINSVTAAVEDNGFKIKKEKTRYLRKNNRQAITGIVVNNEQIGVPKKWVKKLRAAIYNANKAKQYGTITNEALNEIHGMASWLKGVNEQRYKKIIDDALTLINSCK